MKFESQLLKGVAPVVVLQILSRGPMYGYELSQAIERRSGDVLTLGKGTLYPLLYNLEAKKLVHAKGLDWLLEVGTQPGKRRRPVLRVNSTYGIFRAVHSGLGIAGLPVYMKHESPDLVQLLPEIKGPSIDAYFVYPEELRNSMRIAVFRDYLVDVLNSEGMK